MGDGKVILLAADIGGTKSETGLFEASHGKLRLLSRQRYLNHDYGGIGEIFQEVLKNESHRPNQCCCAVAGPVEGARVSMTNLPWDIDGRQLTRSFDFERVHLINDMHALCRSLPLLAGQDVVVLQAGDGAPAKTSTTRAVLAPGTGLGEGFLIAHKGLLLPQGSEGGHSSFAPVTELQQELLVWMLQRQAVVSFEDVASGPAIATLFDFLLERGGYKLRQDVEEKIEGCRDRTPVIVEAGAMKEPCPLCRATLNLFLDILGAEAGNLALKVYARGGVFLGGGVLPRLYGKISFDGFLENFKAKGKMARLMKTFPVQLILRNDAALFGAAGYCLDRLSKHPQTP